MHTVKRFRARIPIKPKSMVGHMSVFEDGTYACKGVYGSNKATAMQMAEEIAKRYGSKTLVTEKMFRVNGENGIIRKPHYIIWERRK